jgi:Ca2+-binding RTX toxin-like protein
MGRRAILLLLTMATALLMASGVALALTKTCLAGSTSTKPCYGSLNADVITGTPAADYINAQNGDDTVNARDGADIVYGSLGRDIIDGEEGNDRLYGDNGDDKIEGGAGDDRLDGSTDNDKLWGEAGNDTLYGSVGNDYLYGGSGCDILYGSLGGDTIYANNKESVCENPETIDGKVIDDKVYGEDGNDRINTLGDGKVDIVYCGFGDDDRVWADPEDVLPVPGNCEHVNEGTPPPEED